MADYEGLSGQWIWSNFQGSQLPARSIVRVWAFVFFGGSMEIVDPRQHQIVFEGGLTPLGNSVPFSPHFSRSQIRSQILQK